ncbi:hypothetical protein UAY_03033 [Enterococcus moraviensis ATCC BAA-383]|uniref:ABC transporter permease n=1 Tax=Enterococcus moraviensis ATCC BAA-383 TaxID=1158609 RepID=R2QLM7_9ENTE|nr:YfhO family protein [Enterococcus moraviensis]EOH96123.1 hypothetical protein UAY_03033 [Enterococcus moraviensis ATCC BAA-383]EOT66095.1 hypothetical protein I586_02366 [Enterococcus moraviensis ATCC BAA-383]OJG65764.1 hypothetical protein RV09_GL001104 [Enterococcus moraviensis]
MQQWKLFVKKNGWAIGFSFFIPIIIMAVSYFRLGIYPTSDRTMLASDGFGQLLNFYSGFNNVLHGKQSFFYTWTGSLGLNFVSLMSYYVNSIFSFLVFFFDNLHMPDGMYMILLTKIGAMGVTFWVYAHNTYRLPQWTKIALSICYALMGFTIAYSIMLMWMDALIYLPLVLLGIQRVMDKKRPTLLFVSYLLLFVSNYYMAFMVGLFSFLYFVICVLTDWKRYKHSIIPYFITSLLAGGASMVIILPSVIDLKMNGEKTDTISTFFTHDLGIWDFIVKSMPGVYDTSKYGSAPFIYVGLFPLLFCIFYFVSKKIPLKNKLLCGSLLLFMIVSVYIQPLNLFWQGLHSPNMFLFRFSFLYSALVLILAGSGLEKFEKKDLNTLGNITLTLIGIFLLVVNVSNKKRYGYITQESLNLTLILLVVYLLIFIVKDKFKTFAKIIPIVLLIFIGGEAFFNTNQTLRGIDKEWGYTYRERYTTSYKDIEALVSKTKNDNDSFYRLENMDAISRTDSFNYDYSGVTMFSSIRNRHSSQYLDQLGYRSPGTNLTIMYPNNTILMDDLMGIKYNLAKKDPKKYGFEKIATHGEYSLYENKAALPLGMLTDKEIYQEKNNNNQTSLIQHLSEIKEPIFQFTGLNEVSRKNMHIREYGDATYFSEESNNDEAQSITWEVNIPEKTQAYLNLDVGSSPGDMGMVEVSVPGHKSRGRLSATGAYYNLGYYEKAKKVKVTATFTEQPVVKMIRPSVLILKTNVLNQAIQKIKNKDVSFEVKGNHVQADISTKKEQVIFTTIPYDQGWQAKIDGKTVKVEAVQEAMIAIKVPKGDHKVQLTYYPKGMKLGAVLFVVCLLLFSIYAYYCRKKYNVKEKEKSV